MNPELRRLVASAPGVGTLAGDDVRVGSAQHPVCGDELVVYLRVAAGTVLDMAWQARACPATMAIASLAHGCVRGAACHAVAQRLRQSIAEHGGLAGHESHAQSLVLQALERALQEAAP